MKSLKFFLVSVLLSLLPLTVTQAQNLKPAKYMVTWHERPAGSAAEYEAAQKRILALFQKWDMPKSLKFSEFLVRVGEFGGYAVIETDNPADIQRLTSAFAAFQFRVEPVMNVMDAVAAESAAIEWRDNASK